MKSIQFKSSRVALVAAIVTLFSNLTFAGAGSSTGGGHVEVCFSRSGRQPPFAYDIARRNIMTAAEAPQLGVDFLKDVDPKDIRSVSTLDLLELDEDYDAKSVVIANLNELVAKFAHTPDGKKTPAIDIIKMSVHAIAKELFIIGSQEPSTNIGSKRDRPKMFDADSSFMRAAYRISTIAQWTKASSGLGITRDFDPKVGVAGDCVYAQAVRQNIYSSVTTELEYDTRLLPAMSNVELATIGLHEVFYNMLLNSREASEKITNPSVMVRRLTKTALMILAFPQNAQFRSELAVLLSDIGYGLYQEISPLRDDTPPPDFP